MLNTQSQGERDGQAEDGRRLNILRRRIALCREQLRQGFDAEFSAVYVREIAEAQRELAELLERAGPVSRAKP